MTESCYDSFFTGEEPAMKRVHISVLMVLFCLICLFTGCIVKKAEEKEVFDPIEHFEELYLKPKAEVLDMLGLKEDDLVVSQPEQGLGYISQRDKYLTENMYLRINYLEDEIVSYYELLIAYDTPEEYRSAYETVHNNLQEKYEYVGIPDKYKRPDDVEIWLMSSSEFPVSVYPETSTIEKSAVVIRMGKSPV